MTANIAGAASHEKPDWNAIDWQKANREVSRLQARIVKATLALLPRFGVGLASLFLIGIGMAMLQVAINPLLRVAGGEEHFAFNSVMAQLIFGLASFISPQIYTYLVTRLTDYSGGGNALVAALARVVPGHLPWISLYWVFAAVTLAMVVLLLAVRLPRVELKGTSGWARGRPPTQHSWGSVMSSSMRWGFCYVGFEQGTANWISQFLKTYHGLDPQTAGADAVSGFWGMMTAGCLIGLGRLKM